MKSRRAPWLQLAVWLLLFIGWCVMAREAVTQAIIWRYMAEGRGEWRPAEQWYPGLWGPAPAKPPERETFEIHCYVSSGPVTPPPPLTPSGMSYRAVLAKLWELVRERLSGLSAWRYSHPIDPGQFAPHRSWKPHHPVDSEATSREPLSASELYALHMVPEVMSQEGRLPAVVADQGQRADPRNAIWPLLVLADLPSRDREMSTLQILEAAAALPEIDDYSEEVSQALSSGLEIRPQQWLDFHEAQPAFDPPSDFFGNPFCLSNPSAFDVRSQRSPGMPSEEMMAPPSSVVGDFLGREDKAGLSRYIALVTKLSLRMEERRPNHLARYPVSVLIHSAHELGLEKEEALLRDMQPLENEWLVPDSAPEPESVMGALRSGVPYDAAFVWFLGRMILLIAAALALAVTGMLALRQFAVRNRLAPDDVAMTRRGRGRKALELLMPTGLSIMLVLRPFGIGWESPELAILDVAASLVCLGAAAILILTTTADAGGASFLRRTWLRWLLLLAPVPLLVMPAATTAHPIVQQIALGLSAALSLGGLGLLTVRAFRRPAREVAPAVWLVFAAMVLLAAFACGSAERRVLSGPPYLARVSPAVWKEQVAKYEATLSLAKKRWAETFE